MAAGQTRHQQKAYIGGLQLLFELVCARTLHPVEPSTCTHFADHCPSAMSQSSPEQGGSGNATPVTRKRTRAKESVAWKYFDKVVASSGHRVSRCSYCSTVLKGWTCHYNIRYHLHSQHLKDVDDEDKDEIIAWARVKKQGRRGTAKRAC